MYIWVCIYVCNRIFIALYHPLYTTMVHRIQKPLQRYTGLTERYQRNAAIVNLLRGYLRETTQNLELPS